MGLDLLVHDLARLYTMDPAAEGLGERERASVGFAGGRVAWVGPAAQAPDAAEILDGRGLIGLPGLVDPHTHAVWAGSRADEFRRRLAGVPYTRILEEGGGILSTVAATRAASEDQLAGLARARLAGLRARGVTTAEVKSGYGLTPESEAKMLRAAARCADTVRVVPTFLGAHAIPPEHRADRARYVRQVIDEQLPLCAPLASFIDVYCDKGAFTLDESLEILAAGKAAGLGLKVHAEQVAHTGVAAAAARLGAISAEHLERIDDAGIYAMAEAGTVAVLLPGAQLYLLDEYRAGRAPSVARLREAGVRIALGTNLNPGSSPVHDPWACATLACLLQGLTIEEAALGITRHAGLALGRPDLGWLGAGSAADMALFAPPPGEPPLLAGLVQHLGGHQAAAVIQEGRRTA